MRPLRYSINVTLDGCCHHEAGLPPDEESMRHWTAEMERADALLFGRVTYEMMESAWRRPATGTWPYWMDEWEVPFAEAIDGARKHVEYLARDTKEARAREEPRCRDHMGIITQMRAFNLARSDAGAPRAPASP